MSNYRLPDCDGLLHNALVDLMNTLDIPVDMVTVDA
jgi:hypothetical protein